MKDTPMTKDSNNVREMTARRLQEAASKIAQSTGARPRQAGVAGPPLPGLPGGPRLLRPANESDLQLLYRAVVQQRAEADDRAAHYMAKYAEAEQVVALLTEQLKEKELQYAGAMEEVIRLQKEAREAADAHDAPPSTPANVVNGQAGEQSTRQEKPADEPPAADASGAANDKSSPA
jgi:hypothetical protein